VFNDLELKRIDRTVGELCRRCSPPERADELRFTYHVDGHVVSIWEERPPWDVETCAGTCTRPRTRCRATCPRSLH
jgi:hypothetical protein